MVKGELQIVTAVHNEEGSIGQVLTGIWQAFTKSNIPTSFVVCEDGSKDNTVAVIRKLQQQLPITFITSPERKGYSRAVLDGLKAATRSFVIYVDSDGQYYPEDLVRLYQERHSADLLIGYRSPRQDPYHRLVMSRSFGLAYRHLTGIVLRDPSCPCLLISQAALKTVLANKIGLLDQGFWWEFYAYALNQPITWRQVSVRHRPRLAGQTDIYRPTRIPGIAYRHLAALFKLQTRLKPQGRSPAVPLVDTIAGETSPLHSRSTNPGVDS